jgi:hypothetical protein
MEIVVPFYEGWPGDVKMLGDASDGPALGAKDDELSFGVCGVHG